MMAKTLTFVTDLHREISWKTNFSSFQKNLNFFLSFLQLFPLTPFFRQLTRIQIAHTLNLIYSKSLAMDIFLTETISWCDI